MSDEHTKEPWRVSVNEMVKSTPPTVDVYGADGITSSVADCLAEANARRIVACVNACAGVSNREIEMVEKTGGLAGLLSRNIANAVKDARTSEQRDKLLEALNLALEYWAHRQQRYKNRHPVWVQNALAIKAEVEADK